MTPFLTVAYVFANREGMKLLVKWEPVLASSKSEIVLALVCLLDAAKVFTRAKQTLKSTAARRYGPIMMSTLMANPPEEGSPVQS